MAVYRNLLLSAGGGIINQRQLAPQVTNTVTLLIGLGGTGVHCIRTIKTQVYDRLLPDDPEAVKPAYRHIRFLGVDSTTRSRSGPLREGDGHDNPPGTDAVMALDDTEFFDIGNANVAAALQCPRALEMRDELSWLEYDKINVPDLTDTGAGGVRQVGRFMMMDKADKFMARVQQEINNARRGLYQPQVNVHVFAGLSGGTGSGCFLDVCYMLRHLAETIDGMTIFGYFFLPDVNLANIPEENTWVRRLILRNGYAAMQELDYCMNLEHNGGQFEQVYPGGRVIPWKSAPVNLCHLISATDASHNVIPDGYDYAMNVTAEYLMNFLTESDTKSGLDLIHHLAPFKPAFHQANSKKTVGAGMDYCVIGASCASVPVREINTYLVSQLFVKFAAMQEHIPREGDAERLAVKALGRDVESMEQVYESLWYELHTDVEDSYSDYPEDWKFVRDSGNLDMVNHYTDQTAVKQCTVERNAQSMMDGSNARSLVNRVNSCLLELARDLNYGPMYACGLLSTTYTRNLVNVVDGLIKENKARWDQEKYQEQLRMDDYEHSKEDFDNNVNRILGNHQKRLSDYKWYLMLLEQHKLDLACFERMDQVLTTLRAQLVELSTGYCQKINRVMDTLLETFRENKDVLVSGKRMHSFAVPVVTVAELQDTLEAEIEKLDIPELMRIFMEDLIGNRYERICEDEVHITKLVTDFAARYVLDHCGNRTITRFLKDKYEKKHGALTDEQLADRIYEDWMKPLTRRASPLFPLNAAACQESQLAKVSYLSYPGNSEPIEAAARKMHDANNLWAEKDGALKDRMVAVSVAFGVPLCAYSWISADECDMWSHLSWKHGYGRHCYEGRPVRGTEFWDWRKLPPITPQSLWGNNISRCYDLEQFLEEARSLYEKAVELKVISEQNGVIYEPDAEAVAKLKEVLENCQTALDRAKTPDDFAELDEAAQELKKTMDIPMNATKDGFACDGDRSRPAYVRNIQEDYFVAAPAYQIKVRKIVEPYTQLRAAADEVRAALIARKEDLLR